MTVKFANRMPSRSVSALVALSLAILMLASAPWLLLQSISWSRMFIVFAQQDSLIVALRKTFDGQHPCGLCLQIRQGQQEDTRKGNQNPREKPEKMPELFCDARLVSVPEAPEKYLHLPAFPLEFYSDFVEPPPSPPPRTKVAVLLRG